ncbi:hypothetical protein EWE75_24250 [Sphingomonas populi]|uniref:Uncharacterized protein n=1 Tax=Sphingomonas populi TaxID=2484750 RepID=A0A4V2DBN9_9SPHN|nr:hypothetical protein [Sphingomonas populi]RZF58648.1 hypothetical protein EWE75_24250 [Sphingomonas populi]
MLDLLKKIYEKNEEFGFSQTVSQEQPPETSSSLHMRVYEATKKPAAKRNHPPIYPLFTFIGNRRPTAGKLKVNCFNSATKTK